MCIDKFDIHVTILNIQTANCMSTRSMTFIYRHGITQKTLNTLQIRSLEQ